MKRLLLEGGGGANGAFLRAGLVDELNLVLYPAVDGAKGAPSVFDSTEAESDRRAPITAMTLESSKALDGGAMWLRYRIENARDAAGDASMARPQADRIIVVGAGAAGLMAARELGARRPPASRSWKRATAAAGGSIRCRRPSSAMPRRAAPNSSMARRRSRTACCARQGFRCSRSRARVGWRRTAYLSRRDFGAWSHEAELHAALQDADGRHDRRRIPAAAFCRSEI